MSLKNRVIQKLIDYFARFHGINARWLWLSFFILSVDQLSKFIVRYGLHLEQVKPLLPWLNLTLRFNQGVAFSLLSQAGAFHSIILIAVTIIVTIYLVFWLLTARSSCWPLLLGLSLIIGGALGNLFDRLFFARVTDFIDFHLGYWHFATFNLADAAVSVGTACLICAFLFLKEFRYND